MNKMFFRKKKKQSKEGPTYITLCWLVGTRLLSKSVCHNIQTTEVKLHYHAPIGALVRVPHQTLFKI